MKVGTIKPEATRAVALIAHDKMKLDLAIFAKDQAQVLTRFPPIATSTTGKVLEPEAESTSESRDGR